MLRRTTQYLWASLAQRAKTGAGARCRAHFSDHVTPADSRSMGRPTILCMPGRAKHRRRTSATRAPPVQRSPGCDDAQLVGPGYAISSGIVAISKWFARLQGSSIRIVVGGGGGRQLSRIASVAGADRNAWSLGCGQPELARCLDYARVEARDRAGVLLRGQQHAAVGELDAEVCPQPREA